MRIRKKPRTCPQNLGFVAYYIYSIFEIVRCYDTNDGTVLVATVGETTPFQR
jgi:hypothetical protein